MLSPDVTEILTDPEVGGGVAFQVERTVSTRTGGSISQEKTTSDATGNIQPENKSTQSSTVEDVLSESIVIYSTFAFQTGSNSYSSFIGPDEVIYNGIRYRVTSVNNWTDWGFTIAHAERVRG